MKRLTALLAVVVTAACSRTPTPGAGELRIVPLGGEVNLLDGDDTSLLDDAITVDSGVSVATGADGRAEVELSGGQTLELAPSSELRIDTDPSLTEGQVLVRTQSPFMIRAGGAEIEASDAVFRVERISSVVLAIYSGAASVLGSGVESVPALRQATILQGGAFAEGIEPLDVKRNDPWDIELLGAAIDLGDELFQLERGLSQQLPHGKESSSVEGVMEREFSAHDIRSAISALGSAARGVVAMVVAQEVGRLDGSLSLRSILEQIVVLRADWIVVVAEWGLPDAAAALTAKLRQLASDIQQSVALPPATSTSISSQTQPGGGSTNQQSTSPSSAGNPGSGSDNNPSSGGNGGTNPPAPPPDEAPPGDGTQPPECDVDCTVEDILDNGPGTPGPAFRLVSHLI